jgi:hypothetical protein
VFRYCGAKLSVPCVSCTHSETGDGAYRFPARPPVSAVTCVWVWVEVGGAQLLLAGELDTSEPGRSIWT